MPRSDRHKKSSWKKPVFFIVLFLFLFLIIGVGYYSYSIMQFVNEVSVTSHDSKGPSEDGDYLIDEKRPFSILLLGMDMEQDLSSRTDTIIVATINPDSEDVKLVSIPRDTLVETDFGFTEKINAMYTYGGIELMITEVEKLLDIPIAHYATIDFQGLANLVDAVSGIKVYSDLEFKESNSLDSKNPIEIKEGWQNLNGEEALGYARMRKKDPRGDYGRQERQQQVIEGLIEELVDINLFTNFNTILNAVRPYLRTNLSGNQMFKLAFNYRDSISYVESYQIQGVGDTEYFPHYDLNVYVLKPDPESLEEVSTQLKDHLNVQSRHSTTYHLQTDRNIE